MRQPQKPPYVRQKKGRWYWEPRGRMAAVWPPCELGADTIKAFAKGWQLYEDGKKDLASDEGPRPGTIAWGVERWRESDDYSLKASGKPKARNSIRAQEMGLRAILDRLGKRHIQAIERRHAKGWYRELRERGDSMAASVMRTASMLFAFLVDEGHREDNPFLKMRRHVPRSTYTPWTSARVRAFFDKAVEMNRHRVGVFVLCVYESAQYPSDVLTWRWDQISSGVYHKRGKTGERAFAPLSDWCLAEIDKLPKEAVQLFVNPATKRPYAYRYIAGEVQRIREAAGLPSELKMRYLRHEAAQEARDGGAGRGDVQSLLAHKSPGTQDYYAEGRDATGAQRARKLWKDET